MIRIGITGGIGSGKSMVCRLFGLLGVPIYDSDSRARRLMNENPDLVARIAALLGREAYHAGKLDRAWVASRVFGDVATLNALNALVHPAVAEDFLAWVDGFEARATNSGVTDSDTAVQKQPDSDFPLVVQHGRIPYVIQESAILVESGFKTYVDRIISVTAPEELRLKRAVSRGGITAAAVRERISRQVSDEHYAAQADYVIRNDEQTPLLDQVLTIHNEILKLV